MIIKVTYEIRPVDTKNFHGWDVIECYPGVESTYFQSESLDECRDILRDLHPYTVEIDD